MRRFSSLILDPTILVSFLISTTVNFTGVSTACGAEDPDSLFRVAIRQQREGNTHSAKMTLRRLLDLYPQYHDGRNLYARLLAWDEKYTDALAEYDSVLLLQNSNQDARFGKAQILAWTKRFDESLEILWSLTIEYPNSSVYISESAKVYLWSENPSQAYIQYEKAYALDSTSAEVVRGLARSSLVLKNHQESIHWYHRLLQLVPADAEARSEITRLSYRSNHELQWIWSRESFNNTGLPSHTVLGAEYYYEFKKGWKPYVHVSRLTKFFKTEIRFGLGAYGRLTFSSGMLLQLLLSPGATVAPRLDATAELNHLVSPGIEGIVAYRFLSFATSQVHIMSPAVTFYWSDFFWMTPRFYLASRSGGNISTTFVSTLFYSPKVFTLLRLGVFRGYESFRATTLNEISSFRSSGVFLGAKTRLNRFFAIDGVYQFNSRQQYSDSHLFNLSISFLF